MKVDGYRLEDLLWTAKTVPSVVGDVMLQDVPRPPCVHSPPSVCTFREEHDQILTGRGLMIGLLQVADELTTVMAAADVLARMVRRFGTTPEAREVRAALELYDKERARFPGKP
jgi:hypothetical protein